VLAREDFCGGHPSIRRLGVRNRPAWSVDDDLAFVMPAGLLTRPASPCLPRSGTAEPSNSRRSASGSPVCPRSVRRTTPSVLWSENPAIRRPPLTLPLVVDEHPTGAVRPVSGRQVERLRARRHSGRVVTYGCDREDLLNRQASILDLALSIDGNLTGLVTWSNQSPVLKTGLPGELPVRRSE